MSIEQAMHDELTAISMSLRDHRYMDPPDGGDVSLAEQVARMRKECDELRVALKDAVGALAAFVDTDTKYREPYETPLSVYDRACAVLEGDIP